MDYLEIEGKRQLERFGIPVNETPLMDGPALPEGMEFPCVLKGQILAGHRGQNGAVKVVRSQEELEAAYEAISHVSINGKKMLGIAACGFLPIAQEYYLGLTLDAGTRSILMLFTPFGGTEIEDLAANEPEKLLRFDCSDGFDAEAFRAACARFDMADDRLEGIIVFAEKLMRAFVELDATTLEINPLVALEDGSLLAIDCKLVIDDNALARQGDYVIVPRGEDELSPQEADARQFDLNYIEIDPEGDIGTMAGGAGIGMATMDTVRHYGGRVNNFLDLGGGVTEEKTYQAMRILLANDETKYVLVNVFGGINNCADMAAGITRAYREFGGGKTVVVKSRGFNQEQGWKMYEELGFTQVKYGTTDEAVRALMALKEA